MEIQNKMEQERKRQQQLNDDRQFREKNILGLFKELENNNQRDIYSLVWSLTAKDLLYKTEKNRKEMI